MYTSNSKLHLQGTAISEITTNVFLFFTSFSILSELTQFNCICFHIKNEATQLYSSQECLNIHMLNVTQHTVVSARDRSFSLGFYMCNISVLQCVSCGVIGCQRQMSHWFIEGRYSDQEAASTWQWAVSEFIKRSVLSLSLSLRSPSPALACLSLSLSNTATSPL